MKMQTFEMERMQSTWEHVVEYDLSESGVQPIPDFPDGLIAMA